MNKIKIERLKKFHKDLEQENSDLKKEIETLKPKPKIAKGKCSFDKSIGEKKSFSCTGIAVFEVTFDYLCDQLEIQISNLEKKYIDLLEKYVQVSDELNQSNGY